MSSGNHETGIVLLKQAIHYEPNNSDADRNRVQRHRSLEKISEAAPDETTCSDLAKAPDDDQPQWTATALYNRTDLFGLVSLNKDAASGVKFAKFAGLTRLSSPEFRLPPVSPFLSFENLSSWISRCCFGCHSWGHLVIHLGAVQRLKAAPLRPNQRRSDHGSN